MGTRNGELIIGKRIRVAEARNSSILGITGEVVDETQNTLVIDTEKGRKKLLKNQITFIVEGKVVAGKDIVGKPEDRITKK